MRGLREALTASRLNCWSAGPGEAPVLRTYRLSGLGLESLEGAPGSQGRTRLHRISRLLESIGSFLFSSFLRVGFQPRRKQDNRGEVAQFFFYKYRTTKSHGRN